MRDKRRTGNMPYAIHEEAARIQMNLNVSQPQEVVPDPLPEKWQSTGNRGLPVRLIPHLEFPIVLYLHPRRPFVEILHRNTNHEIIDREQIPTEHLTRIFVCDAHAKTGGPKECAACQKMLAEALAEGWRREPYIPQKPEKADSDLYGPLVANGEK
jgi:hypothetical protein